MTSADGYRDLAEAAWSWVLGCVRDDDGPWLPDVVDAGPPAVAPGADRDSVYAGIGGLAPLLAEIGQTRALTDAEHALAAGIVARLTMAVPTRVEPSLYDGLAGDAMALRLLAPGSEQVALQRLAHLMTPAGWPTTQDTGPQITEPVSDLVMGTAGIVLAAVWAGGEHALSISTTGGEALLSVADRTGAGLDWRLRQGWPSSSPNYSHGTAGVASALAIAGTALARADFVTAARQGAEHVMSVAWLEDGGLVVPHTRRTPRARWNPSPTPGVTGRPARHTCSPPWRTRACPRLPASRSRTCGGGACTRC